MAHDHAHRDHGGNKKGADDGQKKATEETGHSHEHGHSHGHGHDHKVDDKDHDHSQKHASEDAGHSHEHTHDHGHSHEHGEDCKDCGPKVTTADDVKDVEVPEWKKRALEKNLDPSAAPFGAMSWNVEASTSATDKK